MTSVCVGRLVENLRPSEAYPRHSEGAFLRRADGSLLFVYSRFSGAGDADPAGLVGMISRDEGESWSEPRELISASFYSVENIMSVSLMRMQNGEMGLFYMVKLEDGASCVMLSLSRDEGESFYRHIVCTLSDRAGYYVLNNDRVIRLQSGRLLMPLASHRGRGTEGNYVDLRGCVFFLYSDDDGETWSEAQDGLYPPFVGGCSGLQEPGVVELRSGVIMAHFRTDHMEHYRSFSFDDGMTWTQPEGSGITASCSPLQIWNLGGEIYAVWCPVPNYNGRASTYGGRTHMALAHSDDGISGFERYALLDYDPERSFCYPALCAVKDGLLLAYSVCGEDGVGLLIRKIARTLDK